MATRGRKPKPTAMKVLEGNPGKRPLNFAEPHPEKKLPDCPEWLEDEAKAESKKASKKAAKTEDAPVAPAIEKTTLGDLEELAALKETLSKK